RTRTEDRSAPPSLSHGDRLLLGPLLAVVVRLLEHPRLFELRFCGDREAVLGGLAPCRPGLHLIGARLRSGDSVASFSPRSRTRREFRRLEIRHSTCGSLSMSPIASLSGRRQQSSRRSRKAGTSAQSARV